DLQLTVPEVFEVGGRRDGRARLRMAQHLVHREERRGAAVAAVTVEVHPRGRRDVPQRLHERAHGIILGRAVVRDVASEISDGESVLDPFDHHLFRFRAGDVEWTAAAERTVAIGVFVNGVQERIWSSRQLLYLALLVAGAAGG